MKEHLASRSYAPDGPCQPVAALIYQPATAERDRAEAEALSRLAAPISAPKRTRPSICSTAKALVPAREHAPGTAADMGSMYGRPAEAPGGTLWDLKSWSNGWRRSDSNPPRPPLRAKQVLSPLDYVPNVPSVPWSMWKTSSRDPV